MSPVYSIVPLLALAALAGCASAPPAPAPVRPVLAIAIDVPAATRVPSPAESGSAPDTPAVPLPAALPASAYSVAALPPELALIPGAAPRAEYANGAGTAGTAAPGADAAAPDAASVDGAAADAAAPLDDAMLRAWRALEDSTPDPLRAAESARVTEEVLLWYGWNDLRIESASEVDADGALRVRIAGARPEGIEPPEALDDLPPDLFELPEHLLPAPSPAPPGTARVVAPGEGLAAWLQSASRVLVDVDARQLYVKRDDGLVMGFDVAVGLPYRQTPPGMYSIEAVSPNPTWFPPASIRAHYASRGRSLPARVPPGAGNPLGSWFIKLQDGLGIHGTNQPASIGRAASWGCVRMHDTDVSELVRHVRTGDLVTIVRSHGQPS